MILDLKPYPEMKDSGLLWLGAIPEHWDIKRGKAIFRCIDIRSSNGKEELLTVSSNRGVVPRSSATVTMFKAESYIGYKLCWSSDLVINSLWAWAGGLGVSQYHGIVSSAYGVYRLRPPYEDYAAFIHELVRSTPFNWELKVRSKGIWISRLQLTDEAFLGAPFPLPPAHEQRAIVRFLNYVDQKIGRYIRAKQKLVKLLEEQKKTIIHSVITRGLDPKVPLKPSAVEWLGDVPAHWEEMFLGRCLRRIDQGWSPVAAEGEISSDQWAVLTLSSVKKGAFDPFAIKPIPTSARIPDGIEIKNGDLLLTRSNTRDLVGDACIVGSTRPKTVISDLIYRLTPEVTFFEPKYLMFQLISPHGRRQIEQDARGSSGTMPKISQRHIKSWRVLVPPIEEQRKIVAAIENVTRRIFEAVNRTQKEIGLLREYRTRLISDVVTGKLDVREAAAQLPQEVEKKEVFGEFEEKTEDEEEVFDDVDAAEETEA